MAQQDNSDTSRRAVLAGAGVATALGMAAAVRAQVPAHPRTAGPIVPGRDTQLGGKVAFVTGAARGIGRAIAVELAANGADVAIFDIAGYVSPASNATPATPEELAETARQIKATGRRCIAIKGDIRRIGELRAAHDRVIAEMGRIDIVVANAAIQRWRDLAEMQDSDWNDVIDNNVNAPPTPCARFAGRCWARAAAGSSWSLRCRASTAPGARRPIRRRSMRSSG